MRSFVLFGPLALAGLALGQNPIEIFSAPLMPANHPGDIGSMQIEATAPSASPGAAEFHRPGGAQTVYVSQTPVSPSLATAPAGADPAWGTGLATTRRQPQPFAAPRIYIEPQNGFESYLTAGIIKKHLPVIITQNKEEAQFVLIGGAKDNKETTGSKVLNCVVLFCAGIQGSTDTTVRLVTPDGVVRWAYSKHILVGGDFRRGAEDIANKLKKFLEEHPQ